MPPCSVLPCQHQDHPRLQHAAVSSLSTCHGMGLASHIDQHLGYMNAPLICSSLLLTGPAHARQDSAWLVQHLLAEHGSALVPRMQGPAPHKEAILRAAERWARTGVK